MVSTDDQTFVARCFALRALHLDTSSITNMTFSVGDTTDRHNFFSNIVPSLLDT